VLTASAIDADTADQIARALWMPAFDPAAIPSSIQERLSERKNSPAAFGERMRAYLAQLMQRHNAFIPSYRKRYEFFTAHSVELTPHQAYIMSNLLGLDTVDGYALLNETADLQFPRDHAVSLKHQVGWHFFVGTATDEQDKAYGVELMFWQWALLPPPLAAQLGLTDIENQIMEVHLSMSEAGGRHYRAAPLAIAGTSGLIEVGNEPFFWRIGKNSIETRNERDLFPLRLQAKGWDRGAEPHCEISIDLTFASGKGILLQGGDGCAPCCGGIGTLYYSIPGIVLDGSRSAIEIDGRRIQLVDGTFWMDHQWGTGFLPVGVPVPPTLRAASLLAPQSPGGWDWFPLQFDDNYELTVAAMHSAANETFYSQAGPEPPGAMTVAVAGKMMDTQAATHDIKGTLRVTEWVRATHTNDVQYPASGAWYPNRWEFSFGDPAPPHLREVVMTPLVGGGQTGYFANGAEYLEGATILSTRSGDRIGAGFGEATGYAPSHKLQALLAGLPDDDATLALLQPPPPSALERLRATLYLLWPPNAAELKRILACCAKNGLSQ
jgi:predicted secreted hydrolase